MLADILSGVVKCGPPLDVLPKSLVALLDTMLQLSQASWMLVCALEGLNEHSGEITLAVDATGGHMIEPRPHRPLRHEGHMLHGNAIVAAAYLDGHSVVHQLGFSL